MENKRGSNILCSKHLRIVIEHREEKQQNWRWIYENTQAYNNMTLMTTHLLTHQAHFFYTNERKKTFKRNLMALGEVYKRNKSDKEVKQKGNG